MGQEIRLLVIYHIVEQLLRLGDSRLCDCSRSWLLLALSVSILHCGRRPVVAEHLEPAVRSIDGGEPVGEEPVDVKGVSKSQASSYSSRIPSMAHCREGC